MKLSQLLAGLEGAKLVQGSPDTEVESLCQNSRQFQPGEGFIAIKGQNFDGHLFVSEACDKKASVVFVENERVLSIKYQGAAVKVPNTRTALAHLAHVINGKPSEKMSLIGITGTNGKTTTTHITEAILNADQKTCGVIGTVDNHLLNQKWPANHTTPEAIELHGLLKTWVQLNAKSVAMEVSSHAIAMNRVDCVQFDIGVFTNLSRDHLDFHQTMDEYIRVKAKLFKDLLKKSGKKNKRAILNRDDSHHRLMKPDGVPTWLYGLAEGDFHVKNLSLNLSGSEGLLITPSGSIEFKTLMVGEHNISNMLAAVACGLHLGVSLQTIQKSLENFQGVKGRLQKINNRQGVHVFIDYAHSDDGLKNVLAFLKTMRDRVHPGARLVTVFGCGGDRDKGKRPLMMKTALGYSEYVIATSDNPRTEDPQKIIEDMMTGCPEDQKQRVSIEVDRRRAIEMALKKAKPNDVVLIAGKGHEDYQILGVKKIHFDDAEVAREILR